MRKTSEEKGWVVVSDTAWPGYEDIPSDIMAGYATIFRQAGHSIGFQPFARGFRNVRYI